MFPVWLSLLGVLAYASTLLGAASPSRRAEPDSSLHLDEMLELSLELYGVAAKMDSIRERWIA